MFFESHSVLSNKIQLGLHKSVFNSVAVMSHSGMNPKIVCIYDADIP